MGRLYIYAVIIVVLVGATMSLMGSSHDTTPTYLGHVLSKSHDHDEMTGDDCNFRIDVFSRNNDRPKSTWGPFEAAVDSATWRSLRVGDEVRYRFHPADSTRVILVRN